VNLGDLVAWWLKFFKKNATKALILKENTKLFIAI
jgi:hypothetical protein